MNILSRKIQQTNEQTKPNKDMKIDTTCLFNFFSLSFFLLPYFLPSVSFSLLDLKDLLHCCCNFSMRTCWHSWVTTRIVRREKSISEKPGSLQQPVVRAGRNRPWELHVSCSSDHSFSSVKKRKATFQKDAHNPDLNQSAGCKQQVQRHVHWWLVSFVMEM